MIPPTSSVLFFFFNDTATTEIYTLSLHDALPIYSGTGSTTYGPTSTPPTATGTYNATAFFVGNTNYTSGSKSAALTITADITPPLDRKSTRLNSSHGYISYAVFCLKKKKKK